MEANFTLRARDYIKLSNFPRGIVIKLETQQNRSLRTGFKDYYYLTESFLSMLYKQSLTMVKNLSHVNKILRYSDP